MIQPVHAGPTYPPPLPPSHPQSDPSSHPPSHPPSVLPSHPPSSKATRSTPSSSHHQPPGSSSLALPAHHPLTTTASITNPTHIATPAASSASVDETGSHQQHSQNPQQQHEGQRQQQQQQQQQQGQGQRQQLQKSRIPRVEQWVMEGAQLAGGAAAAASTAIPPDTTPESASISMTPGSSPASASIAMTPGSSPASSAVAAPGNAVITAAGSARALSLRGTAELARCDSLSDNDGAFDSPRSDSFLSLCSDNDWGTPGSAFATPGPGFATPGPGFATPGPGFATPGSAFATPMLAASTPIFTSSTPVIAGSTPTYRGRPPSVAAIAARLARLSPSTHADAMAGADVTSIADGSLVITVAAAAVAADIATEGRHMAAAGGSEDTGGPATCSASSGVKSDGCSNSRSDVDGRNVLAESRGMGHAVPGEAAMDHFTEGSEPFISGASDFEPSLLAVLAESRGMGHASAFADVMGFFEDGGCDEEEEEEVEDGQDDARTGGRGYEGRNGQRGGEAGGDREGVGRGGERRDGTTCPKVTLLGGSTATESSATEALCLSSLLPLTTPLTTATATTVLSVTALHPGSESATGAVSPTVKYPVGCSSLPSSPPHTVTPPMLTWSELSPSPGMLGGACLAAPSRGLGLPGGRSGEASVDGREIGGEAEGRGGGRGGEGGEDRKQGRHGGRERRGLDGMQGDWKAGMGVTEGN
ncbi:unnamed protein product [Closterium sp. Naga37s-1]|nr:unnamed protein product [Closterium sp. Naga37s-1]